MFYLTQHIVLFTVTWRQTTQKAREITRCCYTSRGTLAGTKKLIKWNLKLI